MSFCTSGKALPDKYKVCGRAMIVIGHTSRKSLPVEVCTVCDRGAKA